MQRPPGFKSETQRENFHAAAAMHRRGGPLSPKCGVRTRTGTICTQVPINEGKGRCLRHGGPDAARRYRERQKAGLENGSVTPEEWARAEARRARNALMWAWRKDPRLPGRTIDLGPDEASFAASAAELGVDVDGLYPAVADWLRWRWRRHQKDRPDAARWRKAVREELPRQMAAADEAVAWADLGITDRRTKAARAARAALRAGDVERAQAAVDALRAASRTAMGADLRRGREAHAGPLTPLPARPWTPRPASDGWKRRLPDRQKAAKPQPMPPRPVGRPRRVPDRPDERAALGEVLRAAGAQVRAMYEAVSRNEDRVKFLRDLADYVNAPDDAGAQRRWLWWVQAVR
jgi:hypothetical protein